MLDVNAIL